MILFQVCRLSAIPMLCFDDIHWVNSTLENRIYIWMPSFVKNELFPQPSPYSLPHILPHILTSSMVRRSIVDEYMSTFSTICNPVTVIFLPSPPPSPNTIFTSKSFGSFKTFVRVLVMRRAKVLFMQKVYRVQSMIRRWRALAEFSTGCSIIHVNPAD